MGKPAVIQQWISTVTDAEVEAGMDPAARGFWETLTSDGARPMPALDEAAARAWLARRGPHSEGFRVSC